MRRTKIVCTLGPASSNEEVIRALIRAGMDVARLNFSHGTHETHAGLIATLRRVAAEEGRHTAILQDLQGPRIRIGDMDGGQATLIQGDQFALTTQEVSGNPEKATIRGAPLPQDVHTGDRLLLDDGNLELVVERTTPTDVICKVVVGGILKSHKGVNVPGRTLSVPSLTEKDQEDLVFGVEQGVDYVAMSFVRSGEDVLRLKALLAKHGAETPVIAKIEKHEAIANFDEILKASDGIMVARGDLGIEVAAEEVPLHQKMIIHKCNAAGKPVITATQMLDSMIRNPRPTRAEVNDVANAILDGSDATMLSGETAAGAYPLEAVATMARIAETTDEALPYDRLMRRTSANRMCNVTDAIGQATCEMAYELKAAAIITSTESGFTARMVARHRPPVRIIAATPSERTLRQLALVWGVHPHLTDSFNSTEDMIRQVVTLAMHEESVIEGDLVVITAGLPLMAKGRTNLLKLHVVGEPV
ncbi:MAG TPA: pyruvate kinase [Chloroflexota bacterium]|nr:pyruvate kinase [Chloroflexota bacterium]